MTNIMFSEIENLIRTGCLEKAQIEIQKRARQKNSRASCLQIAHWARRTGLDHITMRLLYATVRKSKNPTQEELAEYSMALMRCGFSIEAMEILGRSSMSSFDKIDLFKSYSYIYQWDYTQARPHLVNYLKKNLPSYERLTAEINLAACDAILNPAALESIQKLDLLQKECESMNASRLQANALELIAQTYIYLKEYKKALEVLNQAEKLATVETTSDGAFIKKWRLFAELGLNQNSFSTIQKIIQFRENCRRLGFFEVVRDCDFHLGIWNRNRSILQKLYFGTPFPAYRQRILNETHESLKIEKSYLWRLNNSKVPEKWIDLHTGQNEKGKVIFDPQLQSLNLLVLLSADFYRPIQISYIFQKLFSGSHFDPFTSPNRINQSLLRLRKSIKDSRIPLIISNDSGLSLSASMEFGIVTYTDYNSRDPELEVLKSHFPYSEFKLTDVIKILNVPKRTLQFLFKKWVEQGHLKTIGMGPNTRYQFIK